MVAAEGGLRSPRFAWLYLVYLPLAAVLLWRGSLVSWDTLSYVNQGAQRPPVYPLFLSAIQAVLGARGLEFVHVLQIAFGAAAAAFFLATLRRLLDLSHLVLFAASLVLASCYVRFPPLANYVLTGGVAFPLFLVMAAFAFRAALRQRLADHVAVFALANLLVLTRHQFLFLYPFCAILLGYRWWSTRSFRAFAVAAGAFVALTLAGHGLERAYHYALTGHARPFPLSGLQLSGVAFYLAKPENAAVLEPAEAELLKRALAEIEARKLGAGQFAELAPRQVDVATHLEASYATIVIYVVFPETTELLLGRRIAGDAWAELPDVMTLGEARRVDSFLLGVWVKLMKANWRDFAALYVRSIAYNVGGFTGLALLAGLLGVAALSALRRDASAAAPIAAAALTLHFGNLAFVALVEPLYPRYVVYTESLAAVVLLACAALAITRRRPRPA